MLGLLIRTPMTVMTIGFTVIFPLVFASNIMVDPATMPGWLRVFVDVNPVSLMTTALRGLMSGDRHPRRGRASADRAGGADAWSWRRWCSGSTAEASGNCARRLSRATQR